MGGLPEMFCNHTEDIINGAHMTVSNIHITCTSLLSSHQVLVRQSLALSLDTTLVSEVNTAAQDGN